MPVQLFEVQNRFPSKVEENSTVHSERSDPEDLKPLPQELHNDEVIHERCAGSWCVVA